jgi:uncharacterized damage-inducible protein DinB
MPATLDLEVLLDYVEEETANWERLFRQNPEALEVKMDVAQVTNARGLLHHIFAVEFRYAERLNEQPNTPFEAIPQEPTEALFQVGRDARTRFHAFIAAADENKLAQKVTFKTVSYGERTVTFRKCLAHAVLHSIRHWAQMATTLRQAGYKQDWQHDFLFTSVME